MKIIATIILIICVGYTIKHLRRQIILKDLTGGFKYKKTSMGSILLVEYVKNSIVSWRRPSTKDLDNLRKLNILK